VLNGIGHTLASAFVVASRFLPRTLSKAGLLGAVVLAARRRRRRPVLVPSTTLPLRTSRCSIWSRKPNKLGKSACRAK